MTFRCVFLITWPSLSDRISCFSASFWWFIIPKFWSIRSPCSILYTPIFGDDTTNRITSSIFYIFYIFFIISGDRS